MGPSWCDVAGREICAIPVSAKNDDELFRQARLCEIAHYPRFAYCERLGFRSSPFFSQTPAAYHQTPCGIFDMSDNINSAAHETCPQHCIRSLIERERERKRERERESTNPGPSSGQPSKQTERWREGGREGEREREREIETTT